MARVEVDLKHAYRLLNHGPVTLVSAAHDDKQNVMAAAWAMPLDFTPPKVCVVVAQHTFTRTLVEQSRELVLQVPTRAMLDLVDAVGNVSGADVDKLARYEIKTSRASKVKAPLIDGCSAWLECVCLDERANESNYDLFVCEVVAAHADDRVFTSGRMRDDVPAELRAIHHVAGGTYLIDGELVHARKPHHDAPIKT